MSETTAVPNNNNVQKTLVVFKPDAVQRGIVGEILTVLNGWASRLWLSR